MQWRAFTASGVDQFSDLAQFGGHAGGAHQRHTAAAHHLGALEQAVLALQHRCGFIQHQLGLLEHRFRFAGERCFAHPQIGGLQQAGIGGHPVAGLQPDQITGHQLFAAHPLPLAIAAHLHHGLRHVAQGQQGLLRLAFLQITQQAIEHHDHQDRDRIFGKFLLMQRHRCRYGRHRQQHDQHHVAELIPEDLPGAAPRGEFEFVRAGCC